MHTQLKTASVLLLFLAVIGLVSTTVYTQSGRRQTKPPPAAPIPTPTPEPSPKPKETPKSDLAFVVGIDRSETISYYPMSFYSAVLEGCAGSLRRGSSANVTTSDRMTRGDAVKKAKAEKTGYVVWLKLTNLSMANARQASAEEIEIEYVVFAPVTAKTVTYGRSYQNANRKGPIVVQPPRGSSTSILYQEMMLKRAAEDAGERILKALHISSGYIETARSFQRRNRVAR